MRARLFSFAAVLFCVLTLSSVARAQLAFYGMGSGGRLSGPDVGGAGANSSFTAYGGTFGVYDGFLRLGPAKLGADGRYFQQSSSNNYAYGNKLRGGLFGLRLGAAVPLVPFKPYVQGEGGVATTNYGVNANSNAAFAYQVQAGLDFTVFPHIDVRGEYGWGEVLGRTSTPAATCGSLCGSAGFTNSNTNQTMQQFGLGVVVRLF